MNTTLAKTLNPAQAESRIQGARKWAALGALLLGMLILFGAGFAETSVLHNAAHDARHAQGFACH